MKKNKIRKTVLILMAIVIICILYKNKVHANTIAESKKEIMYVTAKSGLNLREEPNTNSKILNTAPYNSKIKIIDKNDKWYKGKIKNKIFYVYSKYLSNKSPLEYLGEYKITHYCPCDICNGKWTGQPTASGTSYVEGRTVACNSLPFGTEIMINGNIYTVEDTGNIPNNVIDIYISSHDRCNNLGVYYSDVYEVK